MSRSEAFQMDLRTSPSQQHLNPSRSSSLPSQRGEDIERDQQFNEKSHKLDLYSIPVFLLEVLVLLGLGYLAYFIHFQYDHEPHISGFYCDDIAYRQHYSETKFTKQFSLRSNEITVIALLLACPLVLIIFCELVNSMFGALKFRQIRALCKCCKLHSITRRTIRFSGAYLLGFLIVMISCDILANTTGRLRPYFAQDCTSAYQQCISGLHMGPQARSLASEQAATSTSTSTTHPPAVLDPSRMPMSTAPISTGAPFGSSQSAALVMQAVASTSGGGGLRVTRQAAAAAGSQQSNIIVERHWIDLTGQNLSELCQVPPSSSASNSILDDHQPFYQIAMSWPSFPAAIFTYACLYISCYLSFVGTARPFRIITSLLVILHLLVATIYDVQLVKDHYNHWEDVAAGAALALAVLVFVASVYLNWFKDTHYYEKQRLNKSLLVMQNSFRGYSGDYSLDKTNQGQIVGNGIASGEVLSSPINNDLAMRYFQIPRANYRGAPRPLSSLNQMR